MPSNYDAELDAMGLACPLPVLRIRKALAVLSENQILYVIATDPGSLKDIQAFSRITKNELLEAYETEGKYHFIIRKRVSTN
ncbi:SirA family protein [Candidatus Nitrosoglobus terrae]|uniref:SirA family protein n=1 Tax=Candidatus Nitrosoglobus terrae TaxID=1630141 RepID=A0A1Q2SKS3_9GAMM|nr:sulfurtransferase TusA family protein [Candidatus Nitrosoglobus terrae]BAW79720.1 SirA family protein [Candidatus Nitrosoglobus terrae]